MDTDGSGALEMPRRLKPRQPRAVREKATAYKTAARLNLTRAEARAVADFRARLKEILPHGELKSLILYGSKARGKARRGSDVDLWSITACPRSRRKNSMS
jgi:predicted nucleotidyltransferase